MNRNYRNRMLVFDPDALHRLMQKKNITDGDLRGAELSNKIITRVRGDLPFRARQPTISRLCDVLGCKKQEITYWQWYEQSGTHDGDDGQQPRRCVVCGKTFIPFKTARRPDRTLSVAGWDYCSFQCCKKDNPEFRRRDNRKGPENFRGHGNNFTKRKKL